MLNKADKKRKKQLEKKYGKKFSDKEYLRILDMAANILDNLSEGSDNILKQREEK